MRMYNLSYLTRALQMLNEDMGQLADPGLGPRYDLPISG